MSILSKTRIFFWGNGMKTRKTVFLALFALAIGSGLVFFGCDLLFPPEPTPNAITFRVTAYTPNGQNTESLDIKFSAEVAELTAGDITLALSNAAYVEKGNLIGSGTDWKLGITVKSPFAGPIDCKVTVAKSGVTPTAQSVEGGGIVNNLSKADYDVTSSRVDPATGAAKLTIVPTKAVTISVGEITLINDTGTATKGTLTPPASGSRSYVLDVSVTKPGKIKVRINNNAQVNDAEKTVELETAPTPGTGVLVSRITIRDNGLAYSDIINERYVERGYPKQLTAVIHPENAEITTLRWESADPDIVTVNEKGVVSAGPNKQNLPNEQLNTTIKAKSTDGSDVEGSIQIFVNDKIEPRGVVIKQSKAPGDPYTVLNIANFMNKVTFPMGDKGITVTVYLVSGSDATNDQSMQPPKVITTSGQSLVTVTQVGDFQATENDVPLKRFLIKPVDYKASLDGQEGTITFSSTSNPDQATTKINFILKYQPVTGITVTLANELGAPLPSAPSSTGPNANFKDASVIIATVFPNQPYKSITFDRTHADYSYFSNRPNGNQGNQFQISRATSFDATVTAKVLEIIVEDVAGNKWNKGNITPPGNASFIITFSNSTVPSNARNYLLPVLSSSGGGGDGQWTLQP